MKRIIIPISIFLFSGCAHIGNSIESDNSLATKAAFALGTTANKVVISNRSPSLNAINFTATVDGKSHQCYVTSLAGVVTSDAICSNTGNQTNTKENRPCNALLKAAGKC